MTSFEKEVIDRLGRIETKLDADYRAIHGNGKPGLIDKHNEIERRLAIIEDNQSPTNKELENRIKTIEDRHASSDKSRNRKLEWYAIIASVLGTIYAIFKNN